MSWRIAKTVAVSGGRPPGPPRSPPPRLWADGIHQTGCHRARFLSRLTSAGGSVNPRQGLGAPVQLRRGVGARGEPRCPRLDASGVRRVSLFLRLGRPPLEWVSAEQNGGTEGGRTRSSGPRCQCALWGPGVVADRKNRRGLGRPARGSSPLPASENLGRTYPPDGMPPRTVCFAADVGWRQRRPAPRTRRGVGADGGAAVSTA